jgi:hypothetical protein
MFYYNTNKLVLYAQDAITQDLQNNWLARHIDYYTAYYKDPLLFQHQDTVFITFIVAHLKAGSYDSDKTEREKATKAIMNYVEQSVPYSNKLLMGDLNVHGDGDGAYQTLINYSNSSINFYDPPNELGYWSSNSFFAHVHTQSTHQSSNGCFSEGGLDDRFDFILASESIMNNMDQVEYILGSYDVIGQNGGSYNQAIPVVNNAEVPDTVAAALYHMSDHLPVTLELSIKPPITDVSQVIEHEDVAIHYTNPVGSSFDILLTNSHSHQLGLVIRDLSGKEVIRDMAINRVNESRKSYPIECLPSGIYILELLINGHASRAFKMMKL